MTTTSGALGEPVHGGSSGDSGEFYGDEVADGRPVVARFIWRRLGLGQRPLEQAFKLPDADTWETNVDFHRKDH